MVEYKKQKQDDRTGAGVYTLETQEDLTLATLVSKKESFKASIIKKTAADKWVSVVLLHSAAAVTLPIKSHEY